MVEGKPKALLPAKRISKIFLLVHVNGQVCPVKNLCCGDLKSRVKLQGRFYSCSKNENFFEPLTYHPSVRSRSESLTDALRPCCLRPSSRRAQGSKKEGKRAAMRANSLALRRCVTRTVVTTCSRGDLGRNFSPGPHGPAGRGQGRKSLVVPTQSLSIPNNGSLTDSLGIETELGRDVSSVPNRELGQVRKTPRSLFFFPRPCVVRCSRSLSLFELG